MGKMGWWAALGLPLQAGAADTPPRERLAERFAARQAGDGFTLGAGSFELPRGASVERDIAYGTDPAQQLDVYRPAAAKGAPVIFLAHGGGWNRGDKGGLRAVKNKVIHWVGKGYVLVSINYRVLPQARPLEQADDVAKALAFVQSKAASWGGDPAKVVLVGHSAGAHLLSLMSADPTIATRVGALPWLGTVAIDSAAFDVVRIMNERHFGLYDKAFGADPAYWRDASPLHRLTAKLAAPLLAVCSSRRSDSCAQAQGFAGKAQGLGGRVTVLPVDLSHMDANDQLGMPGPYTDAVDSFLRTLGLS